VRRIEFTGNTTTRDKVIRRELALEEGGIYNSHLWELSLLRLNQLSYFDQLKPDDPNVTDKKLDEKNGQVDLTLKVHEKGKNSIGLNGGVSGLEGVHRAQLRDQQLPGTRRNLANADQPGEPGAQREPWVYAALHVRSPAAIRFQRVRQPISYNQARQLSILGRRAELNLPSAQLQNLQNYSQSSVGFTTSLSYPLRRSFKRVGISYTLDRSTLLPLSTASKNLFDYIAFRGISGPNAVDGIVTSKIFPNFSFNTLDSGISRTKGTR
jgi:outer membrane protein insertion porin family